MSEINRQDLEIGMEVSINPQSDKSRERLVNGHIQDFLTKASHHPHGLLVKLTNGEVGRVKGIVSDAIQTGVSTQEINAPQSSSSVGEQSIAEILANGETHFAEFKSRMLWGEELTPKQIKESKLPDVIQYGRSVSLVIIAKSIAGFLNSDGGTLLIGVKENQDTKDDEVIGVESEFKALKDPCTDGYRRKILDKVIKPYLPAFVFNHFNNYLNIEFCEIDGKQVCGIRIKKSDAKVFMNLQNKDRFFVRIDASTRELIGEEIVDYCIKRFS